MEGTMLHQDIEDHYCKSPLAAVNGQLKYRYNHYHIIPPIGVIY
jgi:hypothetical protein